MKQNFIVFFDLQLYNAPSYSSKNSIVLSLKVESYFVMMVLKHFFCGQNVWLELEQDQGWGYCRQRVGVHTKSIEVSFCFIWDYKTKQTTSIKSMAGCN